MKHAIIAGANSDIAKGLIPLMVDWNISTITRHEGNQYKKPWNLLLIAAGRVFPVGLWMDNQDHEWEECVDSNLLYPIRLLRFLWRDHAHNASVCFMAGSNPQKPMAGYSAYNAGKMALLKVVEQLDFETPEAKFFALGPGYVATKIHQPTVDAKWPNERIAKGNSTPIEKIYDCLKWCVSQPKEVVGGRNICVSDPYGPELAEKLKANHSMYKLRRIE